MTKSMRAVLTLAGVVGLAPAGAEAARATLAVDAPVVRGGLRVGSNTVSSSVYNEQQLPTPLERRGGVGVTLRVTHPDGTEKSYRAKTRGTRFPGGKPPVKVRVEFTNVSIPSAGSYLLTVSVDPDANPIEYSVSQRSGSKSKSFVAGGGSSLGGNADNEFIATVRWNGRPGGGLQARLFTASGTLVQQKRIGGAGKVSFDIPEGRYELRIFRGAQELGRFDVAMPARTFADTYAVS